MTAVTRRTQSFSQPTTLDEALELKVTHGADAMFVAGGTDLGVMLRRRLAAPKHLVSLSRIPELRELRTDAEEVAIGAAVTHRRIEMSPMYGGAAIALREACRTIGSVQTRNVGTIGGNLANASPAADTPPVLLAFDAEVELLGTAGRRRLPLGEFFEGYRTTALADDELLLAVRHRLPSERSGSSFIKLGRRGAMEISISCVGVKLELSDSGLCMRVGIGIGSMAPVSVRAEDAEAALAGELPSPAAIEEAARLAAEVCRPIDDARASAAYRRAVVVPLVRRALETALGRALAAGGAR